LPNLAGLSTPALVIAGEHEGAFGDMKRFAAAISARFEMLLDKSHVTAFPAVGEVCDAIAAFLEEIKRGQFSPLTAAAGTRHSRWLEPRKFQQLQGRHISLIHRLG